MKKIVKLNNKGMTAVEILICMVMVVVITVALFTSFTTYKNKQQIESFKEKIVTYKNLLTKEINDDIIKNGLIAAEIEDFFSDCKIGEECATAKNEYKVRMKFRSSPDKCLNVRSIRGYDYLHEGNFSEDVSDDFMISYGLCDGVLINYPIPDLGSSIKCPPGNDNCLAKDGKIIYDLRINNIDVKTENSVLDIYVGLYHPDLGTRYAINIVAPINF